MGCSIIFICSVILRLLLLYSLSLMVASNSFNDDSSCPSGVANCFNDSSLHVHQEKLNEFFTGLRSELQLPMLPIIQVAIASGGHFKPQIREAQLNNNLSSVVTVDADGLPLEAGDNLHLTSASQVQLGQKLADAFLQNFN